MLAERIHSGPGRVRQRRARWAALWAGGFVLGFAACGKSNGQDQEAYAGDRSVTVWSSTAQVRQPVATLRYGDRVEILEKKNDFLRVRTPTAAIGWTEERALIDSELWKRARALADRAASLPVQAHASAERLTNAHIDPGRKSPRVIQLRGGTPLEVLEHAVAEFTPGGGEDAATKDSNGSTAQAEARREDWALVRASSEEGVNVAGWVLRRFVKYEIPPELLDYSNQYRFVGWFELNSVPGGTPAPAAGKPPGNGPGPPESVESTQDAAGSRAQKPQFLVAGIQGPDGQECDFTLLRVYTWGTQRQRYETAYVESRLCGSLPIRVQPAAAQGGNAGFSFANNGKDGREQREYVMHQTSVRRTDHRPAAKAGRAARGPGK